MKNSFEKQAASEIPAILAKFLEIPENNVNISKPEKESSLDLLVKADGYNFLVKCKSSSARAQLNLALLQIEGKRGTSKKKIIPLIVVPYMGESGRSLCDEHKVSWMDFSGNAHIKAAGLLIHVEGRPNRFKRVGRPSNVFASKSSRIARQLLIEPERSFTQRELSHATGLDEGHTSRIIRRLEEIRLIARDDQGSLKPYDPDQILDAWHEVYDFNKHQIIKGHIAARSGDELLHRIAKILAEHKIDYAATGLAAGWQYTHFAKFRLVTFYFPDLPSRKLFDWLHFREDERGPNTWLVVPHDEGVFHGSTARDGIVCVHPVQIYLDLKGHPERASEAASMLRQEYLNWGRNA
jgi:hypothetical protein